MEPTRRAAGARPGPGYGAGVASRRGRDVLVEVLRSEGVTHVFGNPGTTELPVVDAIARAGDLHYVLALQEATAIGMADGYAQVTGRPAFVNVHSSAGLGNAVGNLTNAVANATPLVVTAGQQDRRHLVTDPLLSGDLAGLAAPVSKWAAEVHSLGDFGTVLRRAFHDAASPPAGPVFVSIPADVLDEEGAPPVPPPSRLARRTVAAGLDELAEVLTEPAVGELAVVVGDEVGPSGAMGPVAALAEALGAPVYGAPLLGKRVFPPLHPMWRGALPVTAAGVRSTLQPYRRVLFVGGRAFLAYPWSPGPPLADGTDLVHLSADVSQLGRAHAVRLGVLGDPAATVAAVLPLVAARADTAAAADAVAAGRAAREAEVAEMEETALSRYGAAPMDPMAVAHALLRAMPPDVVLMDESVTAAAYVRGFHHTDRERCFGHPAAGGLGWGVPAAAGASLGLGGEPVLCVVGDGSMCYSPQALWTMAREGLPVVVAVLDNHQYLILKRAASVAGRQWVGLDLEPPIDFVALARSFGVDATPVEKAVDVGDAVRAALDSGRPHLLHLPVVAPP